MPDTAAVGANPMRPLPIKMNFMEADGFFLCGHCHRVVTVSPVEIEAAESAPDGRLVDLRCPLCRHHEVSWQLPTGPRPKPEPKLISTQAFHAGIEQFRADLKRL